MASRVELSDGGIYQRALAVPAVERALMRAAQLRLNKARYLALKSGRVHFADNLRLVYGVRPGSKARYGLRRPYARIVSEVSPAEMAEDNRRAKLSRTQILRRSK